jgi:hypothetical protein
MGRANTKDQPSHSRLVRQIEPRRELNAVQVMRDNYNGTLTQFDARLSSLTGMDITALDQAVGAWLTGVTSVQAAGSSGFSLALTISPGSSYGEATVTLTQSLTCGSLTLSSGTKITFTLNPPSPQGLSGSGNYRNGWLSLQGALTNGGASGTLEYADSTTSCDTGALSFG